MQITIETARGFAVEKRNKSQAVFGKDKVSAVSRNFFERARQAEVAVSIEPSTKASEASEAGCG